MSASGIEHVRGQHADADDLSRQPAVLSLLPCFIERQKVGYITDMHIVPDNPDRNGDDSLFSLALHTRWESALMCFPLRPYVEPCICARIIALTRLNSLATRTATSENGAPMSGVGRAEKVSPAGFL
jgi:hypothetical protein